MALKKLHYTSDFTNANHNRNMACKAHAAGMSPAQIAEEWPLVWKLSDGKLAQIYDSELSDGRKETRYSITLDSVQKAIKRHKGK